MTASNNTNGFDDFWRQTIKAWRMMPVAERNHHRRLGIAPDIEISKRAYTAMKTAHPIQLNLFQ